MIELIELKKPVSLAEVERVERWRARNRIWKYYPEEGPLRRELYLKHLAFFAAGAQHRERMMMAANRIGKTEGVGAYEVSCHLTGVYPEWWQGKRFARAVKVWAAGDTSKTVREIVQAKLLGEPGHLGTGIVRDRLSETTSKRSCSTSAGPSRRSERASNSRSTAASVGSAAARGWGDKVWARAALVGGDGGESAAGLRVHAQAIRARGGWIRGAIDPASRRSPQLPAEAFRTSRIRNRAGSELLSGAW